MGRTALRLTSLSVMFALFGVFGAVGEAQRTPNPNDPPLDTLPDVPHTFKSAGQTFRVVATKGLSRPFGFAFLPNGDMLVTERAGRLRIVRNGKLDSQPISGIPPVLDLRLKGLQDVAVHPRFSENRWVYFTYYKPKPGEKDVATATLGRGRFDGEHALTDVQDIFVADAWCATPSASRIVFAPDGKIFMTVGVPIRGRAGTSQPEDSQNPANHVGKVLRLNDDGSAPDDNPFVSRPKYRPEIYALGIRNILGLAIHPETGELWENENGPMGGDEINIVKPGRNYGWPIVSYGRAYSGDPTGDTSGPITDQVKAEGMEDPFMVWIPSIAISGMAFYTGNVEAWKGNIFVGGRRGTQLQRIGLNQKGRPILRETLLYELKQRIADVRQGPDGLLYLITDESAGAILRIEPVSTHPTPSLGVADDTRISEWKGSSVTVKEGFVDSNGVKIAYHTAGEGPLVVIVHGISGTWLDWRHQIPTLAQRYQVVAMSTRGTDKSDRPQGVEQYATAKVAADIDAIIRHFKKDKAIIIGQDSGGLHAWTFAMTYPEKTERLIAVGTPHPAGLIRELAVNPDQQKATTFQRGMLENPDAGAEFVARLRSRPARPDDPPEIVKMRKEIHDRLDVESIVGFYKANWPRPPFGLDTQGFGFRIGEFPKVKAPTLMIYGTNSGAFLPGTLNDIWRWIDQDFALHVLPGVGGAPHTEVPDISTPLMMEWLVKPTRGR